MSHTDILELYTQQLVAEGLGNVESFLGNRPDAVEKDKLLVKVLAQEQKVENQKMELEKLMAENEELRKKAIENAPRLESIQKMRQELQNTAPNVGNYGSMNDQYVQHILQLAKENEAKKSQ